MNLQNDNQVKVVGDGALATRVRAQIVSWTPAIGANGRTLVDWDDDLKTLEETRKLVLAGVEVVAVVGDPDLRRAAQARLESEAPGALPTLLGAESLEAEHYAARSRLDDIAQARGQAEVHVAIVGFGRLGAACFDALATVGVATGLGRPRFLILADDAAAAQSQLQRGSPEIAASLDIEIATLNLRDLADPPRSPLADGRAATLTMILLAAERREHTIAACLAVTDLQDRHGHAQAALVIGGPGRRLAFECVAPLRPARHLGRAITCMPSLEEIDLASLLLTKRDRAGRRLHEAFRAEFGGAGMPNWDRLPETYRRANRRAAAHVAQKLWSLGVDPEPGEVMRVNPATYEHVLRPCVESRFEEASVRALARIEHERWCIDRRLDGWVYGAHRDDLRRRHPSLVDFDDPGLSALDISKNISQVRFVLQAIVEPHADGARASLTIGVTTRTAEGEPTGLDPAALMEFIEGQSWRRPVILTELASDEELSAVSELIAALDARGREHALVVLETGDGILPAVAQTEAYGVLVADPHTWIAPIGARNETSADWLGSEASAATEAIVAYLRARCDVWLKVEAQAAHDAAAPA